MASGIHKISIMDSRWCLHQNHVVIITASICIAIGDIGVALEMVSIDTSV